MRTIPILTIAAIVIASTATAYYFLRDNDWAKRAEEAKPSSGSTSTLDVQDTPIRDGRRDQLANLEQPRLTLLQEQVAELEARLRNMETAVSEHSQRQAVSGPDKPASNSGAENAKANKLSEADFARWMDAALDAGYFDRDATESGMEQVETSLAEVPGVNLADLHCSEHLCRATLIPETAEQLNVSQLIGASPFMDSGTIIHESDGSVKVYFIQSGQSLSELRSEAQKASR